MTPPDAPPDTASSSIERHGGQLALVCIAEFTVWLGFGAILPYLPVFLTEQAHTSVWFLSVIASAYFVGMFAFSSLFGRLSDRVGRKPMMVGGTALYTLATLLFVTTTDPYWFVVFRLLEGVGAALITPAAQAFVAEITPEDRRSSSFGWFTTAGYGGTIVGPALAWPLYELGGGHGLWAFRTIFLFGSALTALTTLALAAFLREPPRSADRRHDKSIHPGYRALLTAPVMAIIVAVTTQEFVMGGWEVIWSVWLRHIGAPMSYIGITWTAFSVPMLLSFVGGRVADRSNRFAIMTFGFVVLGASWMVFSLTENLVLILVVMVTGGLAFAFAWPAKQAFLVQVSPPRWLGSVEGLEMTSMQLGALVGTLTMPLLYTAVSGWVFAISGAVAVAGTVAAAPTLRREWRCVSRGGSALSCADAEGATLPE